MLLRSRFIYAVGVLASLVLAVGDVAGAIVTLDTTSRGTYIASGSFGTGGSGDAVGNYLTGQIGQQEFRSFFVFDLSSVVGTVTSATLRLNDNLGNTCLGGPCGYASSDATETLNIMDFGGSIATLNSGAGGVAAFGDLGSGALYGTYLASLADATGVISISLDAAALADINAASGLFAMGGSLSSLAPGANQFLFGSSFGAASFVQLELTTGTAVPEPASLALLGLGLAGLACSRRKQA